MSLNLLPAALLPLLLLLPLPAPPTAEQSTLDGFYRELAWALLGVGQRSLALLVSRARYKVIPSARAAGAW